MKDNRAEEQARAQLDSIVEMMARLEKAEEVNDETEREAAIDAIQEDPLEVSVRSGWHSIGQEVENDEFMILLCTGGPAVRIIGELVENEPYNARLEFQDWGTGWERFFDTNSAEERVLLEYSRQFYFSE